MNPDGFELRRRAEVITRRPPIIVHPWMRGTTEDIMFILNMLKGQEIGFLEDIWPSIKSAVGTLADEVKVYLGLTPEEERQVALSTASSVKSYASDLQSRTRNLAIIYGVPTVTPLSRGDSGPNVTVLQEVLSEILHIPREQILSGVYDERTETAVKKLQSMLNLEMTGKFGFYTAQALSNYVSSLTESSPWYKQLLDIVYPIVAWAIDKPEEQEKIDEMIRQSVTAQKSVVGVPPPVEEKKTIFGIPLTYALIGGGVLIFMLMKGRGK